MMAEILSFECRPEGTSNCTTTGRMLSATDRPPQVTHTSPLMMAALIAVCLLVATLTPATANNNTATSQVVVFDTDQPANNSARRESNSADVYLETSQAMVNTTVTRAAAGSFGLASQQVGYSPAGSIPFGGQNKASSSVLPEMENIDHYNDDNNNTTLLIDYNRQGYAEPTSTTLAPGSARVSSDDDDGSGVVSSTLATPEVSSTKAREETPQTSSYSGLKPAREPPEAARMIYEPLVNERQMNARQSTRTRMLDMRNHHREAHPKAKLAEYGSNELQAYFEQAKSNQSSIFEIFLKKKPYSKYWSVEQKWDDLFKRGLQIQSIINQNAVKIFAKDLENFADVSIGAKCRDDIQYIQDYAKRSRNLKWLMHMVDSFGKSEAGMLTGNMANLGHVIQCINSRAPARISNKTFDERFFDAQTRAFGERFRGKYCLTSIRPVMPAKPRLVSRFSHLMNVSMLSNMSFAGQSMELLKQRMMDYSLPSNEHIRRDSVVSLDEMPFESELYDYLIKQRSFMYSLPKFAGVCYPSSCTVDDIRSIEQSSLNDKHQVLDIEFECEMHEESPWLWFTTPRLVCYVLLALFVSITFGASLSRYILVDKLHLKHKVKERRPLAGLIQLCDHLSMDKCVGILFVKTDLVSPIVDTSKLENERSTSIDALRGFLILVLVYSQLVHLGCLPVPFMWVKWVDAMIPFYRSPVTQIFLNTSVWTEAFYLISGYLITAKFLENYRPKSKGSPSSGSPNFASYAVKRYIRLSLPVLGFLLFNYLWPRLSHGFVMQDLANKILAPCDTSGWSNMLLFHNHHKVNETCLWPSFVSASFFQLHLISYPILLLLLYSIRIKSEPNGTRRLLSKLLELSALSLAGLLSLVGLLYSAYNSSREELIVPFLIDYIDYDNYRRVIEWTVTPTHNHLFSYMAGLLIGHLVVRRRASEEASCLSSRGEGAFLNSSSVASFESVSIISSSQEFGSDRVIGNKLNMDFSSKNQVREREGGLWASLLTLLASIVCLLSTMASSYWNTLSLPMSADQTFWYLVGTKLAFSLSFGYIFRARIATRRNSLDPYMITRFLVPIGRMSLSVFYTSWLVIWFDLLSSLYQWHPSQYFIFEKFNEVMFITLIAAMFAYGIFEGPFKRVQYERREAKRRFRSSVCQRSTSEGRGEAGFHNLFRATLTSAREEEQIAAAGKTIDSEKTTASEEPAKEIAKNRMLSKGANQASQAEPAHLSGKFVTSLQIASRVNLNADKPTSFPIADRYSKLDEDLRQS